MNIRLLGKKALVTGAGKGIGRSICKRLVDCGATTFALSRTSTDLNILKDELPDVQIIHKDVTDWYGVREEITKIGPLDLLVNNAGIANPYSFHDTSKDYMERLFSINFMSVYNISQVVSKGMVENGKPGVIVNISSAGGRKPTKNFSAYCCSKAALDMLTKCLAKELGPSNIRVNGVNPTVTLGTQMTLGFGDYLKKRETALLKRIPMGQLPHIIHVVDAVMFLLSDKSKMINGESITIDGGLALN